MGYFIDLPHVKQKKSGMRTAAIEPNKQTNRIKRNCFKLNFKSLCHTLLCVAVWLCTVCHVSDWFCVFMSALANVLHLPIAVGTFDYLPIAIWHTAYTHSVLWNIS